jgi:hypothetical protein
MTTIRDKMAICVLEYASGPVRCESIVWMRRFAVKIDGVVPEAINVLGQIWTEGSNSLFRNIFAALLKGLNKSGKRTDIVKD